MAEVEHDRSTTKLRKRKSHLDHCLSDPFSTCYILYQITHGVLRSLRICSLHSERRVGFCKDCNASGRAGREEILINASNMIMFRPGHCKTVEGQNAGLGKQTYGVETILRMLSWGRQSLYVS